MSEEYPFLTREGADLEKNISGWLHLDEENKIAIHGSEFPE